jgi:hypothetical protein
MLVYNLIKAVKRITVRLFAAFVGVNSQSYWDYRFSSNWELQGGRLQSALFAIGFVLTDFAKTISPLTVLDYGCGLADSMPVLKMAFPDSALFFFDFSEAAMQKAIRRYKGISSPFRYTADEMFDLVYSSNVVEHIRDEDLEQFLDGMIGLSRKYVVIQAPYREMLEDGSRITHNRKSNELEHERTIDDDFGRLLRDRFPQFNWKMELKRIPIAWDKGSQVFFIGDKVRD